MARSREQAAEFIAAGRVTIGGQVATKAATAVEPGAAVVVGGEPTEEWASRGAHKLLGALAAFAGSGDGDSGDGRPGGVPIEGRRCLDAGASTGGFSDVLLRRGAREVVAVDVGYGQLLWRVRNDERVTVLDRTNVRTIDAAAIGGAVDLVVADLSFISLGLVLPALQASATIAADYLLMVKPQFEVGRERLGPGGVVRQPELRKLAVRGVASTAYAAGLGVLGVSASPLPGPAGNVEYFLWLRAGAAALDEAALDAAVEAGPQ